MTKYDRPSLGFILEGHGEYESYPSIASRIDSRSTSFPRVNARGYGRITKRLEELLSDLLAVYRPVHVICTVDEADVVPEIYDSCITLVEDLHNRYQEWANGPGSSNRYSPLPQSFVVVVQRKKLETWLCADPEGLSKLPNFNLDQFENIDFSDDTVNPIRCLNEWSEGRFDPKNPNDICSAFSACDLGLIESRSRSFQKLAKEIRIGCDAWDSLS